MSSNDVTSITNSVSLIVWSSIGITLLVVLVIVWRVILPLVKSSNLNRQLIQNGLPAQAIIIKTWDTGVTVNDNPRVGFLLEVRPQNQPPFQAQAQMLVSRIHLAMYQPGMPVEVRYDPRNMSKVAISGVSNPQVYGVPSGTRW